MLKLLLSATAILAVSLVPQAKADGVDLSFAGPGVSGTVTLIYGPATDGKYPQGYAITGISGLFSDANNGLDLVNVPITGLVPLSLASPDSTNLLAPDDFSKFFVASGLPPEANGAITYDNLFYPDGSPQTASSYPFAGGDFDIYGVLFDLNNGDTVDLWSNGSFQGSLLDYGVAVATPDTALDYISGGVELTPEPSSFWLLGTGLLVALFWGKSAYTAHPRA